jgi:hypothetical protein
MGFLGKTPTHKKRAFTGSVFVRHLLVGEDFKKGKGQVEILQVFVDRPILPPKWDWQGETAEKIRKRFSASYIWANYISNAIKGIMPGKKW